jgi:hypothetical protein
MFKGVDLNTVNTVALVFLTISYNVEKMFLKNVSPNQASSHNLILEPSQILNFPSLKKSDLTFMNPDKK